MSQPISLLFKFSLVSIFALMEILPVLAEIPITGGEVRGGYVLDSFGDIEDATVSSFILRTPNGNLASPTTTFDNPTNLLAPFLNSPRAQAIVNLNGTAFTPNGEVVIFRGISTLIRGYLDPSSVVGADTLTPSGTVIVDGGTFNLGSTTVSSNGKTYSDSTLNFEVILPGSNPDTEPGEIIILPDVDNPPEITPPKETNNQDIERKRAEQIAAAQREQRILQSRLNELAIQKATAEGKQQTLQDRLNALERQKNISESEKQSLNETLENYRSQKNFRESDSKSLQDKIDSLNAKKSRLESQNSSLAQRDQKLIEAINKIVSDQTLESDINKLEDEIEQYGKTIDNIQKIALFIVDFRKSVTALREKNMLIYQFEPLLEGISVQSGPETISPKIVSIDKAEQAVKLAVTKKTTISFDPAEIILKYVMKDVQASKIADWFSGTSQAIADAKLQISEQKANAVDALRKEQKSTRNLTKQNTEQIAQIDQQIKSLQSQASDNQETLTLINEGIQQTQSQISNTEQEIAQTTQAIQQTQAEITAAQQEAERARAEASQVEGQKQESLNNAATGRSDPMPSNIFPVTSMKQ